MSLLQEPWEQLQFQGEPQLNLWSLWSRLEVFFLVLMLLNWKYKKNPIHTNYSLSISNPSGNRSWRENILHEISLAVSAENVFLCFFLPIFKCNFLEVLKPPDAHLNLISSFSSSIIASNNVKCVHATALILYSFYSFDHMGLKLGGIFMQSYASLPLLVFHD